MAVIPMGTGNAWAKDIGIPIDASEMAQKMCNSEVQELDLGIANEAGFVNVATIGLTAAIATNIPKEAEGPIWKVGLLASGS